MTDQLSESHITAWARLIRASQDLLARVESDLKAGGFPPLVWYDVLLELRRAPDCRLRLSEIGGKILLSKSNVTRVIDRLEARGLATREGCPSDRRGAFAVITAAGRELLAQMWPAYRRSLTRHFGARLSEAEAARLAALLGRLNGR